MSCYRPELGRLAAAAERLLIPHVVPRAPLEERQLLGPSSFDHLSDAEKLHLLEILARQADVVVSPPVRRSRAELESRDDYFLQRINWRNQERFKKLLAEEPDLLRQLDAFRERKRSEVNAVNLRRVENNLERLLTLQSRIVFELASEAADTICIRVNRGELDDAVLESRRLWAALPF